MKSTRPGIIALLLVLTSCAPEDTRASSACVGSGTAKECHACCKAQGDRNYMFRESHTTKRCMCQLGN
jgi:Na+-transporting NADH:ubiquinone oxidoreductase subunit NqrF